MTAIRRPGAASAAVLIGLSASLVVAHLIAPEWSRRTGLDVWNLTALEEQYRVAVEQRQDVVAHAEQAATRRATANQIAAKLIAGTTPLPVAADELAEVFHEDEGMRSVLRTMYQHSPTTRHMFARHAIDRVKGLLVDEPAHRKAVVARLEVEYQDMGSSPARADAH
jgi:hypothetical protein